MTRKKSTKGTRAGRSKRSGGEDMTGKKEGDVEVRKASAASELPLPKLDKQIFYWDSLKRLNDQKDAIVSKIRTLNKNAKSEHVDMAKIKEVMAMEKGDQQAFRNSMEQQAQLMRAKGITFQMHIFDTAYGSDVEQAKAEARAAALAGKSPDCRYAEGTDAAEAYMQTYAQTQASMVPGAGDLSEDDRDEAIAAGRASTSERQMEATH
jgi:hypothetical protein